MVVDRGRPRRPRWLILGIVLTLSVLAVNALASGGPDDRQRRLDALSYADRVRPAIADSNQQAADLRDIRDKAADLGRAAVNRRLTQLERESAAVVRRVRAAETPEAARTARDLLVAALHLRHRAAAGMAEAIGAALGSGPVNEAVEKLVAVGDDIRASDRNYVAFRDALPAADRDSAVPPSQWAAAGTKWDPTELAAYVATLRSANSLVPLRDVAVVLVTTRPAPVGTDGSVAVLPPVKDFEIDVVVANVGNVAEKQAVVLATLLAANGATETRRLFVDVEPGQRHTLTIRSLKPPVDQVTTLTVEIGPQDGETSLDDNRKALQFVVRGGQAPL